MGWSYCGQDDDGRDIGYGIGATCDQSGCSKEIHRGLAYCCGGMHGGGAVGCGKYFCGNHLFYGEEDGPLCDACLQKRECPVCGGTGLLESDPLGYWGSTAPTTEVQCYECCPQDDEPFLGKEETGRND